jgi:hypothetical protein
VLHRRDPQQPLLELKSVLLLLPQLQLQLQLPP